MINDVADIRHSCCPFAWLNRTVLYASQPLSPVATQHSLPSGRYSLLGPDFHRLDRTSLRLAHSLDHLVGTNKKRVRYCQPECLRGFEIDDQFELRPLHDRQIAGFFPFENPAGVNAGLAICVLPASSVADQAAGFGNLAISIDCRHGM